MSSFKIEENLFIFWAKTSHDKEKFPNAYHPLLCHMIDVAVVARLMWDEVLPQAARNRIADALGLSPEIAGKVVSWIAGLHDLGKASPPFTLRETRQDIRLLYENTPFALRRQPPPAREAPHGYVTASELPEILHQDFGFLRLFGERIAVMIGGHHGVFPRSGDINNIRDFEKYCGSEVWADARRYLTNKLAQLLDTPHPVELPDGASLDNATVMFLAGLVSVADWIGSNSTYFECEVKDSNEPVNLDALVYKSKAEAQARKALAELGWLNWSEAQQARRFDQMFPFPARPLQTAAINIADSLTSAGIVVIEAPMGEGKTEAAMYLADHWNVRLQQRGIYFALPTQATSNQMFGRVRQFLMSRFEDGNALLHLLHGHASLSAEFQTLLREGPQAFRALQLQGIHDDAAHAFRDCTPSVVAAEWFTYRKRGLLAPFGVGTVDQALLAVLQTRHVFVRLFGLAHKAIIVDEVHAYDAYMSALLERLLEWLAALGSPVLLLSATLPKQRRDTLVRAYLKGIGAEPHIAQTAREIEDRYPRITWATAAHREVIHIQASEQYTRALGLRHIAEDISQLGESLQRALRSGGCAAVICNTVQRAQDVYEALKPFFRGGGDDGLPKPEPKLDLLHARYLFKDRAARETRTLIRFGKEGGEVIDRDGQAHQVKRPGCAVLVSTQIIEQSLDLDFDLMVTELAPADLVLQRAGRLHRHIRDTRPHGLHEPTLWICQPAIGDDGKPDFGKSRFVYDEHILLRSWLAMKDREQIAIPDEVEEMIESVYDTERRCPQETLTDLWDETKAKLEKKRNDKESKASRNYIVPPDYEDLLEDFNPELEEDNPEFHRSMQALTRDDDTPSISVVLLRQNEKHRINVSHLDDVRYLLERSVNVSTRGATQALIEQMPPSIWRESPMLRHHRLLELDEGDRKQVGGYLFHLHPDLGIVISKTEKEEV